REHLLARGDRLSKMFLPPALFSVHAEIIREQMGEDLTSGLPIPFPKPGLRTAYEELGAEIVRARVQSPQQFSLLGFNPDYLMNGESAILTRWLQQLGNDEELAKFLNYYFWRALQHRPGSFATKISRQMGVFYAWQCPAFIGYRRVPLVAWHYRHSLDVIKDPGNWEQLGKIPASMPLLAQTEQLSGREIYFDSGKRLFFYHTLLARAYLPVLLVSVTTALCVILIRKPSQHRQWPSLLVLFLFLSNFGNVLAVSAVHSMEVQRYSTVQFLAALFAELWAFRYLLDF